MHLLRHIMLHCNIAIALLLAMPARADGVIGLPVRVGVMGGYQLTSSDFDVLGVRRSALRPGDGALLGLRFGWRAIRALELELAVGLVPAGTPTDGASALLLPAHLDLVVRPFAWVVAPYASVGGGVMALVGGDAGSDADALFSAAIGVELVVDHSLAFRFEVGLFGTDAVAGAMAFSPTFVFGLDVLAWRPRHEDVVVEPWTEPAPPPVAVPLPVPAGVSPDGDDDDDDVDNEDDRCPLHPGEEGARGCPDTDRDGLIDPWDRCPIDAGTIAGCPDADGDGVPDRDDACPNHPGPASRYGCPGG
ncbi:MAG: hypothetical protein CVU56_03565 [Deltaproteobacteria bacterium HGW-Deltaproteobacteria-14]|jgi:hypothetical protein|nr:MAG: hypothetical protein CVU56_03565 [Deltaproteobacteria bacterium HGW-Deltaproteobacteria-14]